LLEEAPETVNESPFDDGWFFKVKPSDLGELDGALTADGYKETIEADA